MDDTGRQANRGQRNRQRADGARHDRVRRTATIVKAAATTLTACGALDRVRAAGERAAASAAFGISLQSVEPAEHDEGARSDMRPLVRVTLGLLDESLRPCLQIVDVRSGRELAGLMRMVAPANRARMRMAARLAAADAIAMVDPVTVAALAFCGTSAEEVARRLASGEQAVRLTYGGHRELKACLSDGRLRCAFEPDDRVRWTGNRLVVRERLPETHCLASKGRPLSTIVEHPALPGTLRIVRAEPAGDDVEITLRLRTRPVRPEPRAPGSG